VNVRDKKTGEITRKMIETVVGRVIFNTVVPEESGYVDELLTKKKLQTIIADVYKQAGLAKTAKFLDDIKEIGFQMAYRGGLSIGLNDVMVPVQKEKLVANAQEEVDAVWNNYMMGLITDNDKYAVLSDILGDEDHLGDMDFKVTGTVDGITACQMDIKVDGLSYEVLSEALEQAKAGRMHILGEMAKTITEPRADYKEFVPRIEKIVIPKDFIGAVIGPGGKVVQEIQKSTNTVIVITEDEKCGMVEIASTNKDDLEAAKARVKAIVAVPEVGEIYDGTVKSIMPFGAFVEILPGKDGLLHISEIDYKRLETMDGVLKEGDKIQVKLIDIDSKTGKLRLSRKALLPKPEGYVEKPERPRGERKGGDHKGGEHRGPRREKK
jgi:polyribonucleotide nucleotidyltransferase